MRILCLILVFGFVGSAEATPNDADARRHFQRGRALYAKGRYADALTAFSAGYDASGRPLFLFNMAECARLAGEPDQARELYERYLTQEPQGELAETARRRLEAFPRPAPPPSPDPPVNVPAPVRVPVPVPLVVAPTPPPLVATPPPPPRRTPVVRRWPFWAAIGGVVVLGSLAAYAATRSGGGGGDCPGCPVVDLR